MKLLLYCTKAKPYLADFKGEYQTYSNGKELDELFDKGFNPNDIMNILNGKIVAECDFEVEEIVFKHIHERDKFGILHNESWYEYKGLNVTHYECDLASKGGFKDNGLLFDYLFDYLVDKEGYQQDGYAIHIKNIRIFQNPRKLSDYTIKRNKNYDDIICDSCTLFGVDCKQCHNYYDYEQVMKAPRNMMKVCEWDVEDEFVMPVKSEEMARLLKGEQSIIIRKRVSKELL